MTVTNIKTGETLALNDLNLSEISLWNHCQLLSWQDSQKLINFLIPVPKVHNNSFAGMSIEELRALH